jgi:myo-inositol-1(or 4)-monophosphatase
MQLSNIIQDVEFIAKKAGAFIREERLNFQFNKAEVKAKNDLVSYVDKTSEKIIVDFLSEKYPFFGFITEENTLTTKKEINWIIDPLDGTTNFVHGIPCYAVSIGLEQNGKIIAGVVYEVAQNECFSAFQDNGAFLNGKQIAVTSCSKLADSLIATGFPVNNFSRMQSCLHSIEYFMRNTHGVRRIGSAASDLCYLACGRVDAFYEYNLNSWDVAAGSIIVEEAGGKISDFSFQENYLFGREIMASSPILFDEFSSIIHKCFSPDLN